MLLWPISDIIPPFSVRN